jgi:hypothetical protein
MRILLALNRVIVCIVYQLVLEHSYPILLDLAVDNAAAAPHNQQSSTMPQVGKPIG